jgi:hypothetical protein
MPPTEPPGASENEDLVLARLAALRKSGAEPETVRIEWRGAPRNLPVIDMPVEALYYNPDTHRIRAQRAHDPVRDAELAKDHWSPQSQAYLHDLLMSKPDDPDRRDPDFVALMEDLNKKQQNDAGLITPSGILVNGNTRRAALKELGKPNIRVGVLPEDWGWDDISTVELSLQLRKLLRREYSYINEIITIGEETRKGRTDADLAKAFGKHAKTIRQSLWVLSFIEDAIERSDVILDDGSSVRLRLMDFEGHQESLREIHDRYMKVKAVDGDLAERLKESSLTAVLMNKAKTDIRAIWAVDDFDEKYLKPKLSSKLKPEAPATISAGVSVPGLTITLPADDAKVEQAKSTTDKLLKAKTRAAFSAQLPLEETTAASAIIAEAQKAIDSSIDSAKRDAKQKERKLAAPEKLDEATDALRSCIEEISKARSQSSLDDESLDDALVSLRDTLTRLARAASRGVTTPGEGLAWLQHATLGPA